MQADTSCAVCGQLRPTTMRVARFAQDICHVCVRRTARLVVDSYDMTPASEIWTGVDRADVTPRVEHVAALTEDIEAVGFPEVMAETCIDMGFQKMGLLLAARALLSASHSAETKAEALELLFRTDVAKVNAFDLLRAAFSK